MGNLHIDQVDGKFVVRTVDFGQSSLDKIEIKDDEYRFIRDFDVAINSFLESRTSELIKQGKIDEAKSLKETLKAKFGDSGSVLKIQNMNVRLDGTLRNLLP